MNTFENVSFVLNKLSILQRMTSFLVIPFHGSSRLFWVFLVSPRFSNTILHAGYRVFNQATGVRDIPVYHLFSSDAKHANVGC